VTVRRVGDDVAGGADEIRQATQRFIGWLKSGVPVCRFIPELHRRRRILPVAYAKLPSAHALHEQFMRARERGALAIAILPRVRSDADLAVLLDAMATDEHFAIEERPTASTSDTIGVDLFWTHRASAREWSSATGFAPSWSMPSARRAPRAVRRHRALARES
jgi:hypothetical protein